MNNKEFIAEIAQRMNLSMVDTQKLVSSAITEMSDQFQEGNSVTVPNFGTFEVKKKLERVIVTPSTKQRMLVPPKLVLNFKQHIAWKEKLKNDGGQS